MVASDGSQKAAPKKRAPKKRRPGEGSVYRRGNRWTGAVDLGYVDGPGGKRRRRITVNGETAEEVAKSMRLVRARADVGLIIPDGQTSTADFLRSWLETKSGSIRATTVTIYRRAIETHLIPFLGHHRLDRLSPVHVQGFISAKLAAGMSATTVRTTTIVLIGALKSAQEWGLVSRNVASIARLPPPRRYEARPLSGDEARSFLSMIEGSPFAALYWLLIGTGLRIGEALGLRWQDVDLEAGLIHVRHSLQKVKAGVTVTGAGFVPLTTTAALVPPKTPSSRVTLAVPAVVVEVLRQHRGNQAAERQAAGDAWRDHGLVFTTPTPKKPGHNLPPGSPVDYKAAMTRFKEALAAADLPPIRLHDLRHTCAVLLIEGGDGNLKQVQRQMRHSNIGTTLDVYGHVSDALQARAARNMDDLLGKKKSAEPE